MAPNTDSRERPERFRWPLVVGVLPIALAITSGCVRRSLTVTSEPPGALVYLNDREAGRTPFTTDFTWYGVYDVAVRAAGHETLKTSEPVIAPWWQWPPFDFFAEFSPARPHDERRLHYVLTPSGSEDDPAGVIARGESLRDELPRR